MHNFMYFKIVIRAVLTKIWDLLKLPKLMFGWFFN